MESTLTLSSMAALFGAMVLMALVPGVSVLTVSARSATAGFSHGAFATLGILVGDVLFILLAIFGLMFLAEAIRELFVLIQFLGGAYLLWLGGRLCRSKIQVWSSEQAQDSSLQSSFMVGLLITLGDQKAILFYLSFFPAFFNLAAMSIVDVGIVVAIAMVAVGGVKLGYAYAADRAGVLLGAKVGSMMKLIAGFAMIAVGTLLVVKALAFCFQ